eukprot:NODE_288_length_10680_cov_0.431245.p3 type:complete len:471 gc:universal NODE_288_length_10680_cov_0.431245:3080-1668(-)
MILVDAKIERISSTQIKINFPKLVVEQLHLKIHPINTPKTIHVLIDEKEVGFINCVFDQTKIFKKKIKLHVEADSIELNCEPYHEFVEFIEVQVFALEFFKELPSMLEENTISLLPTVLESCTLLFPREILQNVASSEFIKRFDALNEILSIMDEASDSADIRKCITSLLNFLLVDNRPKIVLLRIKFAKSVTDLIHLERLLESAYDYQEYIQNELIEALVAAKMPLHMLLKSKPKLIPICLKVVDKCNYKASAFLAEYILNATKTGNRDLALRLWYEIAPSMNDKVVVAMVEKNIENARLQSILLKNLEIDASQSVKSEATKSKASLHRSRPNTAADKHQAKIGNFPIRKTKSQPDNVSRICVFCEQMFVNFKNMDSHYYECPMLTICTRCDQIIEVSCYSEHLEKFHSNERLLKFVCPFCKQQIIPENDKGWRNHLVGFDYNCLNVKETKIPVRQPNCTMKRSEILEL